MTRRDLADDLRGGFEDVVREYQDRIYGGCLRMLGDPHSARDAAQEAFLRAYRALSRMSGEQVAAIDMSPWLWTIATNVCRNHWRTLSRRPEAALDGHDPAAGDDPAQAAVSSDTQARLAATLLTLPWHSRAAVVMRHVVGLSYSEIAAAVARPEGTVKSDVSRALRKLRVLLEEES